MNRLRTLRAHKIYSSAKVENWLWRRGLSAQGSFKRRNLRVQRCHFPDEIESLKDPSQPWVFHIPVNRLTTPYGFSFDSQGWHPYVATLEELIAGTKYGYFNSSLATFHKRFQPPNLASALTLSPQNMHSTLRQLPHGWPLVRDFWLLTARNFRRMALQIQSTTEDRRSPHVGPFDGVAGAKTYERLVSVYKSMKREGYAPEAFDGAKCATFDGYPLDGYFVADDSCYRFVILHGHHRAGAAAVLGVTHVTARVRSRYVPVVDSSLIPRIASRTRISESDLMKILFELVYGTGRTKAREWSLV